MQSLIIAFLVSFLVTIFIIRTQKLHSEFSADFDLNGPQKFHKQAVPRIGGLAIGLGLLLAIVMHYQDQFANIEEVFLYLCALPTFLIGLTEDITKKMGVRTRLLFTAIGALLAIEILGAQINRLSIPYVDNWIAIPIISISFTIFATTGLANAYNIIDGFNGLSSMVGMITLIALGYLGIQLNDALIIFSSFVMVGAILGFFIWNYPRGAIFLGDGGAYLIGFWVAVLSILLVSRHQEVSPWFAVMVNAYPIMETLFSIYRRKFHQNKNLGHPDGIHLHSLIFRRILNPSHIHNELEWFSANAKTSPYLWVLCTMAIVPAVLFWNSTPLLIASLILFSASYVWLYRQIVTFRTPRWMHL